MLQEIGIPFEPDDGKHVKKRRGAIKLDDPMQERIVQSCVRPQSIDELANQLKLSLPELQTHLFDLQIAGIIEQDFSGMWKLL